MAVIHLRALAVDLHRWLLLLGQASVPSGARESPAHLGMHQFRTGKIITARVASSDGGAHFSSRDYSRHVSGFGKVIKDVLDGEEMGKQVHGSFDR